MLRDNDAGKEYMDRAGHREGLDGEVVEILITPFEAEMLRVVIEAMRGCCEEETHYSLQPKRRGRPLRIVERRDS